MDTCPPASIQFVSNISRAYRKKTAMSMFLVMFTCREICETTWLLLRVGCSIVWYGIAEGDCDFMRCAARGTSTESILRKISCMYRFGAFDAGRETLQHAWIHLDQWHRSPTQSWSSYSQSGHHQWECRSKLSANSWFGGSKSKHWWKAQSINVAYFVTRPLERNMKIHENSS